MANNQKADPRIQLEQARLAEKRALVKLKEKEKEMRLLLAELQTMKLLKAEAVERLEDEQVEDAKEDQKHLEEDINKLENLVGETETARLAGNDDKPYHQREEKLYTPGTAFAQAASAQTIEDLYAIRDKPAELITAKDRETLAKASHSLMATMQYQGNLSDVVSSAVNRTYEAVKNIVESRPDLVQTYVNDKAKPVSEQFFSKINDNIQQYKAPDVKKNITLDYKLDKK